MIEADLDTRNLMIGIKKLARVLDKDIDDVVQDQAKIMIGQLVGKTPPAGQRGTTDNSGRVTRQAKVYGEAAVKADIAKLFPTTRRRDEAIDGLIDANHLWKTDAGPRRIKKKAMNISDMARLHKQARSKATGRVRVGRSSEFIAISRTAVRREYQKQMAKKVGTLSAGWLKAAHELKASKRATPSWITRQGNQPGGIRFRNTKYGLSITVENNLGYFPRDMKNRLGQIINRRTAGLLKQSERMLDYKIRKQIQKYF